MDSSDLEKVVCDLCGCDESVEVFTSADHWLGFPGVFSVVRCVECSLFFINPRPRPADIGKYYPQDYYAFNVQPSPVAGGVRQKIKRKIRASRWLSLIASNLPVLKSASRDAGLMDDIPGWIAPGTVLDVGCGTGFFLDELAENGWQTYGIEPGQEATRIARTKGHKVFPQSATENLPAEIASKQFDLIWMSHSLEHVHSPSRALTVLKSVLKPVTGHLVIEVPNVQSLLTFLFREFGLAFDSPRHLYMFSPATLTGLLQKNGYKLMSMRHISRPQQFLRCFEVLSKSLSFNGFEKEMAGFMADRDVVRCFDSLSSLAAARGIGGAIRIVAKI